MGRGGCGGVRQWTARSNGVLPDPGGGERCGGCGGCGVVAVLASAMLPSVALYIPLKLTTSKDSFLVQKFTFVTECNRERVAAERHGTSPVHH